VQDANFGPAASVALAKRMPYGKDWPLGGARAERKSTMQHTLRPYHRFRHLAKSDEFLASCLPWQKHSITICFIP
jgi:hypothetical protein